MSSRDPLNPARFIIQKFGGTRPAARTLQRPPSTIQGWLEKGVIPADDQDHVLLTSDKLQLGVQPAHFFRSRLTAEAA
jgi:hypothetical protein